MFHFHFRRSRRILLRVIWRVIAFVYSNIGLMLKRLGRVGKQLSEVALQLNIRSGDTTSPFLRESDIFLVTYPRSGTTWMQMILYQMTSEGDVDFDHISAVSPWYERAVLAAKMSSQALENLPEPRVFKCHLRFDEVPKTNGKYIYVMRDGMDVAVSYYHHYRYFGYQGSFDEFYQHKFLTGNVPNGRWFTHVKQWRENKDGLDVLYINYRELKEDLMATLRKIGEFCQLQLSEDKYAEVAKRADFTFMKQYQEKFDHGTEMLWELEMELQQRREEFTRQLASFEGDFIRHGKIGEGQQTLSAEQRKQFDAMKLRYQID